eukprot:scaffold75241_cov23-Tisochrysis_lutea.AAC.1
MAPCRPAVPPSWSASCPQASLHSTTRTTTKNVTHAGTQAGMQATRKFGHNGAGLKTRSSPNM